jgi:DNA-binding MarR family transcriptional regulator
VKNGNARAQAKVALAKDASAKDALVKAKTNNAAHSLLRAARLLNELAVARTRQRTGEKRLRPSHTAVLPHLDLEGTRLTDLAARMGISKQAASELVSDLEALGMVDRQPDPDDGRARRVCFTAAGRRALLDGLGLLQGIEGELAQKLGAHAMADLARLLPKLEAALANMVHEQAI